MVEDQLVIQKLMKRVLAKEGYEVDTAGDRETALQMLTSNKYEIAQMDIQMPELNGYEVTKRFREMEKETDSYTPILAMRAN